MSRPRVLIIDDDAEMVSLVQEELARHGYAVTPARSGTEGLEVIRDQPLDVIAATNKDPRAQVAAGGRGRRAGPRFGAGDRAPGGERSRGPARGSHGCRPEGEYRGQALRRGVRVGLRAGRHAARVGRRPKQRARGVR